MNLIALALGNWVFIPFSVTIRLLLRFRGVHVGRGFRCSQSPKIIGRPGTIRIGKNCTFNGTVELRTREDGQILIGDQVKLDAARIVAAREAVISLGEFSVLGRGTTLNSGAPVTLGKYVLVSGYVYIQGSMHGISGQELIAVQPHTHRPISIGDGVWIGAGAKILYGHAIGRGAVVGAQAVVTRDVNDFEIVAGIPATHIRYRT